MGHFTKATKSAARARVALTGPSGAGKTLSALLLAKGLTGDGKVAVIDSENASASLYADKFNGWEYSTLVINPPYTAQKYIRAIDAAIGEGFEAVIIDSLSHVWAGEGGLLEQKDAVDSRGGNKFTNWNGVNKLHEQLKSKLLISPIHVIATMRSKQQYVLETGDGGKSTPKKVGLAPIQRDGMEYEFTLVLDIGMDHQFKASKDRTDLFDGVVAMVTEETGKTLKGWLTDDISFEKPETVEAAKEEQLAASPEPAAAAPEPPAKKSSPKKEPPPPKEKKEAGPAIPAGPGKSDPGAYVVPFGEGVGIKGKRIDEIPERVLIDTVTWCREELDKGPVHSTVKVFEMNAVAFLKEMGTDLGKHQPKRGN